VTKYFGFSMAAPPGKGWVRLLVDKPKRRGITERLLGRDDELTDWAVTTAHDLLDPDPDPDLLARYAKFLTEQTLACRSRDAARAYAWLPEHWTVPAVLIEVTVDRISRARPEITLDMLEKAYAATNDKTHALEVSQLDLPAGPTIRIRREWGEGNEPSDIAVSVTYAIRPRAIKDAIHYMMYWVLIDDYHELTEIADDLAKTVRITTDV
jgi:hypothetical protein